MPNKGFQINAYVSWNIVTSQGTRNEEFFKFEIRFYLKKISFI